MCQFLINNLIIERHYTFVLILVCGNIISFAVLLMLLVLLRHTPPLHHNIRLRLPHLRLLPH